MLLHRFHASDGNRLLDGVNGIANRRHQRVGIRVDADHEFGSVGCGGEHFGEAWVRVRKAGGATALVYLVYNFEDVFIKAVRTGGMSGDEIPLEEVTFGFAQFTIDYSKQAAAGSVAPGKFHGGWNIKANKKA